MSSTQDDLTDAEVDDLTDWPKLDPKALYGLAGDIVGKIAPHTEADPVAILIQILAAFGNAVGRNPFYKVEADHHYPNIYAVIVGASAKARKGVSKGHCMAVMRSVDEIWAKTRQQSGLSSGEGLISAVRDETTKKEPIKQKGIITGYQDVIIDAGVDDKRLFVFETEFAKLLRVLGRDGNTLSAIVRDAWDTGDLQTLTKNSPLRSTGAHITIMGHVTVDELLRYLDNTEMCNGFANRFLWLCVKRSKILPEGGRIQEENFSTLEFKMRNAIDEARKTGEVKWTQAARVKWCEIYQDLSAAQPGLLGALTARAEAQVVRLALLYALLDSCKSIDTTHLEAAIALWKYCEQSVIYIFGELLGDPVADQILTALKTHPDGMTRTEISDLFHRHVKGERIGQALNVLQKDGKVKRETVETGGRTAERWYAI